MQFIRTIAYPVGLLMTMLVFMRSYEPKKLPGLRFAPFMAIALYLNYLSHTAFAYDNQLGIFIMLLMVDVTMALGMAFTFNILPMSLLSASTSGVALQHMGHHLLMLLSIPLADLKQNFVAEIITVTIISLATVLLFGKTLARHVHPARRDKRLTFISFVIVLICIGITRFTRVSWDNNNFIRAALSLYAITCCVMAMFMQHYLYNLTETEAEKDVLRHMQDEEKRHFQTSRETSEQLHIIYHDLKHKLTALQQRLPEQELQSMQQALDTFSDTCHTGLDSLDVVLDEKYRLARSRQVTITFMGSGQDFAFMDPLDIYSMFGNLLDNAITAAEQLPEQAQKIVSITSERRGSFLYLMISNYLPENVQLSLVDGLPTSTKMQEQGFHGYGLRSVRATARKYNGDMMVSSMDQIFTVTVYMLPAGDASGML